LSKNVIARSSPRSVANDETRSVDGVRHAPWRMTSSNLMKYVLNTEIARHLGTFGAARCRPLPEFTLSDKMRFFVRHTSWRTQNDSVPKRGESEGVARSAPEGRESSSFGRDNDSEDFLDKLHNPFLKYPAGTIGGALPLLKNKMGENSNLNYLHPVFRHTPTDRLDLRSKISKMQSCTPSLPWRSF
jgi:hypothetical protein